MVGSCGERWNRLRHHPWLGEFLLVPDLLPCAQVAMVARRLIFATALLGKELARLIACERMAK